jgi:uncharacterized protein
VILIDTNLLVYAQTAELPQHARAQVWLDRQLNGVTGVGMPWSSLLGFVRIVSNPRLFKGAVSVADAWGQVDRWLAQIPVWIPQPADRHGEILGRLIPQAGKSDLVADAHLAALALEYDLTLMTTDRDFARFDGLRWENPIAG